MNEAAAELADCPPTEFGDAPSSRDDEPDADPSDDADNVLEESEELLESPEANARDAVGEPPVASEGA